MTEGSRRWATRLLALAIAIGIWFSASVEDRLASSEKLVETAISYNRPRGYMVLNPVGSVSVRITGSKKAIRQLNPLMVDVQVDLRQRREGPVVLHLGRDNVLLPRGLEVVSIEPNPIRLTLEREVTQRVDVVAQLIGEPAAGAILSASAEVVPDQVLVSGPASLLAGLAPLKTRPVSLDGHAISFEETVALESPDPLIHVIQPTEVTVRVSLALPDDRPAGGRSR
jgi:YbbR domain-containing protein